MSEPIIYVVDDDNGLRESACLLLQSNGYAAVGHPDGESFLAARNPAQAGCVVLDLRMPGLSGLEVQEELAARGDKITVIVVSGHGDVQSSVQAMKAGAVDFIEKPYTEDALLAAVNTAIGRDAQTREIMAAQVSAKAAVDRLTPREHEVFALLAAGHPTKTIANRLDISVRTAEVHRGRVMEKLDAENLAQVVRIALAAGTEIQF